MIHAALWVLALLFLIAVGLQVVSWLCLGLARIIQWWAEKKDPDLKQRMDIARAIDRYRDALLK